MNTSRPSLWIAFLFAFVFTLPAAETSLPLSRLQTDGAFGFPQKDAKILYDQPILRFSVWNNHEYLFAQAVLWTDDDGSLGKTEDNRKIGDWSKLSLDLDADEKPTPQVDRDYLLNPWPELGGLHYDISMGAGSTTGIMSDSKGKGAIRYVELSDGRHVRVDNYLIPLTELSRKVGDKIKLSYWGFSPKPLLTVNSAGYERPGRAYYAQNIPRSKYNEYVLAPGAEMDATVVPEGRNDITVNSIKHVPMPQVAESAPEISAKEWINVKEPLTLAGLRGKVVVVEFWATWCGPCQECIPHLNELCRHYAGRNFQLLSLVEEGHLTMDRFLARKPVDYPIGLESTSLEDYGITGIPHAFVINQAGKIVFSGHSAAPELEQAIVTALGDVK